MTQAMTVQAAVDRFVGSAQTKFADLLDGSDVTPADFALGIRAAMAKDGGKLAEVAQANPVSLMTAVGQAAALRLNPNPTLQHFYLIPFGNRVEAVVGYRGLLHLALQSGLVEDIEAVEVYQDEVDDLRTQGASMFDDDGRCRIRAEDRILHDVDQDPAKIVGAVAAVKVRGRAKWTNVALTKADIDKRRKVNKGKSPAWDQWPAEQCRKTALRALLSSGRVPLGHNRKLLEQAIGVEETTTRPIQVLTQHERRELDPLPDPEQAKTEALADLWQLADANEIDVETVEAKAQELHAIELQDCNAEQIEAVRVALS